MTALLTAVGRQKQSIAEFREEFVRDLPQLAREYIDTARAENTTAAMEKVINTALKIIEGLEVAKQPDKYANLPTINFVISGVTDAVPLVRDVEDVTPKPITSPFASSAAAAWLEPDTVRTDPPSTQESHHAQAAPVPSRQGQEGPAVRQGSEEEAEVLLALERAANAMAVLG